MKSTESFDHEAPGHMLKQHQECLGSCWSSVGLTWPCFLVTSIKRPSLCSLLKPVNS